MVLTSADNPVFADYTLCEAGAPPSAPPAIPSPPPPSPPPSPPPAPPPGNGWYWGNAGENCNEVCARMGGGIICDPDYGKSKMIEQSSQALMETLMVAAAAQTGENCDLYPTYPTTCATPEFNTLTKSPRWKSDGRCQISTPLADGTYNFACHLNDAGWHRLCKFFEA